MLSPCSWTLPAPCPTPFRVIAFEPVPHFHAFLEYSVHANHGLAALVDMRGNVVSHESGKTMNMV